MATSLRVLVVGKLRPAGLADFEAELVQRSRTMCPIEVVSVRSQAALFERAETPRVVLDERGAQIDSRTLADWIGAWRDTGHRRVDFLIGDAHGFSDDDRAAADRVLALSRLTLPHRLARLLLVEQLYRAGTILAGHPYHHEG